MALPRLPFLYPNFLRSVRSCEPPSRPRRLPRSSISQSSFYSSSHGQHGQDTYPRRYGPAAESQLPPPSRPKEGPANTPLPSFSTAKEAGQAQQFDTLRNRAQAPDPNKPAKDDLSKSGEKNSIEPNALNTLEHQTPSDLGTAGQRSTEQENQGSQNLSDNPLDAVIQMPSEPASFTLSRVPDPESRKPAHLSPPRYVHQFDTYGTIRALEKGGFTEEQSITIMKAIRGILQDNLELARESITSKSDFENELYLFKAACSELQSSLQTARNAEVQRQRSSRTHLQHEVDILSQRLNQELTRLKDDLKGMFNDHKMTTRDLQRSLDTVIQELNYKITISLTSDGKGTTEGLRLVLARRAASAILTSASMSNTPLL